ncbi:MAG: hypothetical protein JSW39_20905, partial [Desulfobacterales bacterium]
SLHALVVQPGQEQRPQAARPAAGERPAEDDHKKKVQELGRDILPVHGALRDLGAPTPIRPKSLAFGVVMILPVLAYLSLLGAVRYRRRSGRMRVEIQARKAAGEFVKRYRKGRHGAEDLIASIRDYLNQRCGLARGALTAAEAAEIIRSRGVGPERAERLRSVIGQLEDAVYTGRGQATADVGEDLARLIKEIDKEIQCKAGSG